MDLGKRLAWLLSALMVAAGCNDDSDKLPASGKGTFVDYGYIPQQVDMESGALFQAALYYQNTVYVATSDGLWKNDLATKTWTRAGLEGKDLICIYQHSGQPQTFFAGLGYNNSPETRTVYISTDGCQTWNPATSPVYDNLDNRYEPYVCFAARPGYPNHIFANVGGGAMMAISKDGGQTWDRTNYAEESYMGYPCAIAFLPNDADHVYQSGEAPLDVSWLAKIEIDATDPVRQTSRTELFGIDDWENRRCNQLSFFSGVPNTLYVGQEGALSKVTGNTFKFIFKSPIDEGDEGHDLPYSYIKGIWVDGENPKHLLFGGRTQEEMSDLRLYETFDEGKTIAHISDPMGMRDPDVVEILDTDTYPVVVVYDAAQSKVRLLMYQYK
ncbi:MAG: hypothetical protein QM786_17835 [Breznakibacter sp.]